MSATRPHAPHALTALLASLALALATVTVLAPAPATAADPAVPASASGPLLARGSVGLLDANAATMSSFTSSGSSIDSVDTGITGQYLANGAGVLADGDLAVGVRSGVKRVNPLTMHVTGDLFSGTTLATAVSPAGDLVTGGFDRQVRRQQGGTGAPTVLAQTQGTIAALAAGADGSVYVVETEKTYVQGEFTRYLIDLGTLVRIRPGGARTVLAGNLVDPVGLSLSPDGSTVYAMQGGNPSSREGERSNDGVLSAYDVSTGSGRVVTSVANRFVAPQSIATLPDGNVLISGKSCRATTRPDFNGVASCTSYASGLTQVDPATGAVSDFALTSPASSSFYASSLPSVVFVYDGRRVPSPTALRPDGVADTLSRTVQNTSFGPAEIRLPVMANDRFTGDRGFVRIADGGTVPGADSGSAQPSGRLRAEGDTIVYKPTGEGGSSWFTYYVWNDGYRSGPVRVDLTVVPAPVIANDFRPVANPDQYVARAGEPLVVPAATSFLANDTDADPVDLLDFFYFPVPDDSGPFINRNGTRAPQHGTLEMNLYGEGFTYTPDPGFSGTDTFVYGVLDDKTSISPIPSGQLGTVTVTVVAPPLPAATAPATQSFDVLAGTTDPTAAVDLLLPTFTSSRGPVTTRCTTPGGTVVTGRATLPFGTTLVTCRSTDDLGQTTRFDTTVEVHRVSAVVTADRSTAKTGERVPFTVLGRTDDGRDVGDVSSQVVLELGAFFPGACEGTRCYRTNPGPLRPIPLTRSGRLAGSPPVEVTVVTGDPARLSVLAGGGQTASVNSSWADAVSVRVADAYDNSVAGAPVTFSVFSGSAGFGDGLAQSTTVATENDGSAATTLRTGPNPGQVIVRASSPGTPPVDVVGRAVAGSLGLVSGGGQQVPAGGLAAPVSVSVADGSARPIAGVPLTFEVVSGSASFGGAARTTVRTGNDGGAAATPLLSTTPGPVVVRVSGIGTPVETTISVVPGPAATLRVTPSSTDVVAGSPVRFTVTGTDRYGNATGDLASGTTLASGDAGVSCQQAACTATRTGQVTVTATYGALAPVDVPLRVLAAPTASLVLSPAASSAAAGAPVAFAVAGRDAYGNPTGDLTGASTLATTSGGASCAAGACTGTRAGSYAVTARSAGLTSNAATVTVTPAAPDTVAASGGSGQSTVAGSSFADPLVATVSDAYGNPVRGVRVTFTVPAADGTSGSATFPSGSTVQVVTGSDGRATSPVVSAGAVGPVTATAAVAGITDAAVYSLAVTQAGSPRADLTLGLAGSSQVAPGATTTLTATVRNAGPSAAVKTRTALLVPRGWTVVDAGGATRVGRQVLVFQAASVASGASAAYRVTLRAPSTKGGALVAGISLSGTQDPKYANNLAAGLIQVK